MSIEFSSLDLRSYSNEVASHQHDYHQLVLPVEGCLSLSIEQAEGDVTASKAAIIAAGASHGFFASDRNMFLVADVPSSLAPRLESFPAFIDLDEALTRYVRFLSAQVQAQQGTPDLQKQMLGLLIQLLQEKAGVQVQVDQRVAAVKAYIAQNLDQAITLPQLAGVAHLSVRQLSHVFTQSEGCSPQHYLIEQRMQRARDLLESTDLSVQRISESVGYSNLAAFSDRFRQCMGRSPRHFRRLSKEIR